MKCALLCMILITAFVALPCSAADAYLVEFREARGKQSGCAQAVWATVTLLYNRGTSPAIVTFLDMGGGTLPPDKPRSVTIPPGTVVDLRRATGWDPQAGPEYNGTWVLHIDVPPNVTVENRNEVTNDFFCTPGGLRSRVAAKVSIPVVRQLVDAGVQQVVLGSDVVAYNARQNVMIYNAGAQPANARIEVRRACDGALVDSGTAMLPARSIHQIGPFATGPASVCPPFTGIEDFVRYTVVTVDQPSFATVSTLTETPPDFIINVTPLIELNVAINGVY